MAGRVRHVECRVLVPAPPERVWLALTDPAQVAVWDGAEPLAVPAGYPAPGQHARWRTSLGPFRLVLHDRVAGVDPPRRLGAVLDVGPVHVEEQYHLVPVPEGTEVVSENLVSSTVPGLGRAAHWLVRRSVEGAMARLAAFCSEATGPGA